MQPGLHFINNRLLLSLTAFDMPCNAQISEASRAVSIYRGNPVVNESEFRVRELQFSIGTRF